MFESVEDLEWAIFLASRDNGRRGASDEDRLSSGGTKRSNTFLVSSSVRVGEPDFRCSIILIAACSSARFSKDLPLRLVLSSSSLELWADSGGEMVAPVGINEFVTGGGDWRRLPCGSSCFRSSCPSPATSPLGIEAESGGAEVASA